MGGFFFSLSLLFMENPDVHKKCAHAELALFTTVNIVYAIFSLVLKSFSSVLQCCLKLIENFN